MITHVLPFQHFMGQVIAVQSTDDQGPEGVKLTLARTPIKAAGPEPTTHDLEFFSTAFSVKE